MSSIDDPPHSRRHPRFNGRRVRISDLLEAGLLRPGQKLLYQQRQGEVPHESVVTEHGRLKLTDGREFDTPSAAGAAVSKLSAVHGWAAWKVSPRGPSLHQLRQQLIQGAAAKETEHEAELSDEDTAGIGRIVDFLADAEEQAAAGAPKTITVRGLLDVWRFEERDRDAIHQIGADLDNAGLTTVPDFRAVSLDRTVKLVIPSDAPDSIGDLANTKQAEVDDEPEDDIGLTLGNLAGKKDLVWVPPSATLEKAITLMEINDFSQLPVLADDGYTLHGAVSWESIARQRRRAGADEPALSDVVNTRVMIFDYDVRLLDALDTLQAEEFIVVRDFDRKINGIITAADVVQTYNETATPFFLIGEIDQELRQLIRNKFDLDTVRRACRAGNGLSFDNLTMYHYQSVLNDPDCWKELEWGLDREVVVTRLDEIRHVRNKVMHFNVDLVAAADVQKLRYFLRLIRRYAR